MDIDVDGGTLLYLLGIGFAFAALAYFARDVVFSLSITVKAALLFLSFLSFLLGGIAIDRDVLDDISLILSGAAYVVFVIYVVSRHGLDATGVFFVLFGSALLFVALGYTLRTHQPTISPRIGAVLVAVFVGLAVLLIGADVATAGLTTSVDVNDSVTVSAPADAPRDRDVVPGEGRVGTLTVTNEGPFTRSLSLPELSGCLVGTSVDEGPGVSLRYNPRSYNRPDHLAGGESTDYRITARLPIPNGTDEMTYAVERGSNCEVTRDEPTLIVLGSKD